MSKEQIQRQRKHNHYYQWTWNQISDVKGKYYKQLTDITNGFCKHGTYTKAVAIEKGKWSILGDNLIVKLTISCTSINVTKRKNQLVMKFLSNVTGWIDCDDPK